MLCSVHSPLRTCQLLSVLCGHVGSEAKGAFTPVDATPVRFRRDGVPISACRIPGRPLMVRCPTRGQQSDTGLVCLSWQP